MHTKLSPVIEVIEDRCVNCHACIAACPVKTCNIATEEPLSVNHDACIGCGSCFHACTHSARGLIDDLDSFLESLEKGEEIIVITAPSVVSNFPDEYLHLNGWLRSIGVAGIFDVGFGAELTVKSYAEYIKRENPELVIAQPCPVIVSYIELYRPELRKYLAPIGSPMHHTIQMIREFYPEYENAKIAAIAPCIAKRREFDAIGDGHFIITYSKLREYLEENGVELSSFPETEYDSPQPERAVHFPIPGGLLQTISREIPGIAAKTRKIEGPNTVYDYLDTLPEAVEKGWNPKLIDCLNCEFGCNFGPGNVVSGRSLDELERQIEKRFEKQLENHFNDSGFSKVSHDYPENLKSSIDKYWNENFRVRNYRDLSANTRVSEPSEKEIQRIYREVLLKSDKREELNCGCCGYQSCRQMAIALYNGLSDTVHCYATQHKLLQIRESRLAENESILNGILDVATEGYSAIDSNGIITHVNDRYLEIWGFERKKLIGNNSNEIRKLIYEQIVDPESFQKAFEHSTRQDGVIRLKDSRTIRWHSRFTTIKKGETYQVWSYRDITETENAISTISRNERMLQDIITSIHDDIFIIDRDYKIVRANAAMENSYADSMPLIGKRCHNVAIGSDSPCENCSAQRVFEGDGVIEEVINIPGKNGGKDKWGERTTYPLVNESTGKIDFVLSVQHDVTETKEQELKIRRYQEELEELIKEQTAELRYNEAELRAVLENSTAAIAFGNSNGKITYTNSAMQKLLGYRHEELEGMTFSDLGTIPENEISSDQPEDRISIINKFLSGEIEHYRIPWALKQKNGTVIWCDMAGSSLPGRAPGSRQLLCVLVDITDRMNMIKALSESKEEAEAASRAKSQFLAHMSHEIRTPLNGIIGLTELLLGSELNEKQREYGRLIRTSGKSLLFLINDILDFSKIEAGKLEVQNAPFELVATLESAMGILASRAFGKNLDLCMIVHPEIPHFLSGDEDRIRQVLINLIGNAIKFTDEGGVFLRTKLLDPVRNLVQFEIIDSGIGIPTDRLHRLFRSFSQIDTSYARKHGGTGLGLAISRRLIELMGGKIDVESKEEKGSNFHFTIPFDSVEKAPVRTNVSQSKAKRDAMLSDKILGGHKILIVGINEVQKSTLREQLEMWKLDVDTSGKFDETLAKLLPDKNGFCPYSILVVDFDTEDMPGNLFIEEIRAISELAELPIIHLVPLSEDAAMIDPNIQKVICISKPVFNSPLFDAILSSLFAYDPDFAPLENDDSESSVISDKKKLVHILVAEDNPINQIVTKETLLAAGFTCDIVANGRLACEATEKNFYDLILMDCQMPEMDGLEATIEIRKMESNDSQKMPNSRIPIIALTANATTDDMKRCIEIGMDAFCSKPINPKNLIESINNLLES